jgi:hypothetical protein
MPERRQKRSIELEDGDDNGRNTHSPKEQASPSPRDELQGEVVEYGGEGPGAVNFDQNVSGAQTNDRDAREQEQQPALHPHAWYEPFQTGAEPGTKAHLRVSPVAGIL